MSTHHRDDADRDPSTGQPRAQQPPVQQGVTHLLRSPGVRALLASLTAVLLFWLGTRIGGAVHRAFDGDTGAAVIFGAVVVLAPAVLVALGVAADRWLDAGNGQAADDTRPTA